MRGCTFLDPKYVSNYEIFALKSGDLVIATVGSWPSNPESVVGKTIRVPLQANGALLNQNAVRLRGNGQLDQRFLFYLLRTTLFQTYITGTAQGSASQASIALNDLFNFEFCTPPIPEQRAIAHILGAFDDKIEVNRRMNETLEGMARALFKSWFVDFDPVRAKAAGRDPGLPKHLADLFPNSLKPSDVGTIPNTWMVKTAGEVAERIAMGPFGSSIKVETFVEKGVPIISGQHLHDFMVADTKFNFVTEEHAKDLGKAMVQRGDVVFTHAGNIGQVAIIPQGSRYERYVISQRQFYMRCDLNQVSPWFIALYFSTDQGRHRLLANTSSSGVPSIARPVSYLRSIQLALPPINVLSEFDRLIRPVTKRIRENLAQNEVLAIIRDALLPKLISGQLRLAHEDFSQKAYGTGL
jgi:type I restriction enzyme S subunit